MARGWESKSVEQQQADKTGADKPAGPRLSPAQMERNRKRDGLLLTRSRLSEQIRSASHPRHRQMLEQAAAEIDRQLSSFDDLTGTHSA